MNAGDRNERAPDTTDVVLVVPGMDSTRLGQGIEKLLHGLEARLRQPTCGIPRWEIASRLGEGLGRADVTLHHADGTRRRLVLRELAWTDIRPSMKDVGVFERLLRGLSLVRYWIGGWAFRIPSEASSSLRTWLVGGAMVLAAWYGAITATAIGHMRELLDQMRPEGSGQTHPVLNVVSLLLVAALGIKVLTDLVDIAWTSRAFLLDAGSFRTQMRIRMRGLLAQIRSDVSDADRIIVLAHSFGSAIAVDAIAGDALGRPDLPPLHLMTLGTPLEFLAFRDPDIGAMVDRCFALPQIRSWSDFNTLQDAFCSRAPITQNDGRFTSPEVKLSDSMFKINGITERHLSYFGMPAVLDRVLGLIPLAGAGR